MLTKKLTTLFLYLSDRFHLLNDDEMLFFVLCAITSVFALFLHVLFLVFYLIAGSTLMVIINIGSICIYMVSSVSVLRKKYFISGLIIGLEISIYALLTIRFFGNSSLAFLFFYLVMLLQIVVPYASAKFRTVCFVLAFSTMIASYIFFYNNTSLLSLGKMDLPLQILNIVVFGVTLSIEFTIINALNSLIRQTKELRIIQLQDQACLDALTGLYNRHYANYFFLHAKRFIQIKSCVAILDIDNFKAVNDQHGHSIGDKQLVHISSLIKNTLRASDTVFRWGGEEFLVILSGLDALKSQELLEKLRRKIEKSTLHHNGSQIKSTVTIGLAEFDTDNISESISICDTNLYEGKRAGKNCVISSKGCVLSDD